jgi:hypothetical protein
MIDNFSIGLTHGLMLLAAFLLLLRPDLDREDAPKQAPKQKGWKRKGDNDA